MYLFVFNSCIYFIFVILLNLFKYLKLMLNIKKVVKFALCFIKGSLNKKKQLFLQSNFCAIVNFIY